MPDLVTDLRALKCESEGCNREVRYRFDTVCEECEGHVPPVLLETCQRAN